MLARLWAVNAMPEPKVPPATAAEGSGETPQTPLTRIDRVREFLRTPAGEPAKEEGNTPPEPEAGDPTVLSQPDPAPTAPEGEGEGEGEGDTPPENHAKAVERIRKLRNQKRELKGVLAEKDGELARIRNELDELKRATQPTRPLPDIEKETDTEALASRVGTAGEVYEWATKSIMRLVDDSDVLVVGKELESAGHTPPEDGWTRESVHRLLLGLQTRAGAEHKQGRARLEWLEVEAQAMDRAAALYPEMADETTPLGKKVESILHHRPWLKTIPDWPLLALAGSIGLMELEKRAAEGAKPKPAPAPSPSSVNPPKPAPKLPKPAATAPTEPDNLARLRQRVRGGRATVEERRAYIASQLKA